MRMEGRETGIKGAGTGTNRGDGVSSGRLAPVLSVASAEGEVSTDLFSLGQFS